MIRRFSAWLRRRRRRGEEGEGVGGGVDEEEEEEEEEEVGHPHTARITRVLALDKVAAEQAYVLTASDDRTVKLWRCSVDVAEGEPGGVVLRTFTGHCFPVVRLALGWSLRDSMPWFASASQDGTTRLWKVFPSKDVAQDGVTATALAVQDLADVLPTGPQARTRTVSAVCAGFVGRHDFVAFAGEQSLLVWLLDVVPGRPKARVDTHAVFEVVEGEHTDVITDLAFYSVSRALAGDDECCGYLVSACNDAKVRLLTVPAVPSCELFQCVRVFEGHSRRVLRCVADAEHNPYVALSLSTDRTIRSNSLATGSSTVLGRAEDWVVDATVCDVSPAERYVCSLQADGSLITWRAPSTAARLAFLVGAFGRKPAPDCPVHRSFGKSCIADLNNVRMIFNLAFDAGFFAGKGGSKAKQRRRHRAFKAKLESSALAWHPVLGEVVYGVGGAIAHAMIDELRCSAD